MRKLRLYHHAGVPRYRMADPHDAAVTVMRHSPDGYITLHRAERHETISPEAVSGAGASSETSRRHYAQPTQEGIAPAKRMRVRESVVIHLLRPCWNRLLDRRLEWRGSAIAAVGDRQRYLALPHPAAAVFCRAVAGNLSDSERPALLFVFARAALAQTQDQPARAQAVRKALRDRAHVLISGRGPRLPAS